MEKNGIFSISFKEDKEDVINRFNEIIQREGKTKSKIVIQLIEDYVKAHSEGNDTFKLDTWVQDSEFKAVPTILEHDKSKWVNYVNSCNESERRDLSISCNFVLRTIHDLTSKTDIQLSNHKSYDADRLRNDFDITNKDPSTLTIYQREQLKRYQEATKEQRTINF